LKARRRSCNLFPETPGENPVPGALSDEREEKKMGFAENLQYYRKREGMTQEQLAEKLDVSRQTVSKWEMAVSYPEMDKILQLCDLYSCSMDVLMRGDAEENSQEDTCHYDQHMTEFNRRVTAGIAFLIGGLAVMMGLNALGIRENLSVAAFLLSAMVGILILVVAGIQQEAFKKRNPYIQLFYGEEEKAKAERLFPVRIAVGIGFLLAGTILVVICGAFPFWQEGAAAFLFLAFAAAGVPVICYAGLDKEKYEIERYNKENCPDEKEALAQKKIAVLCGCTMLIATIVYLALGFLKGMWEINWVVYVLGGILCGIETLIVNYRK
jgi:transcriptional regulator with XRE-family HTH domain